MPAKNPRVNVVLERPLYATLDRLARRDGTSLSSKARDLLRDALELYEDIALAEVARARDATFDRSAALTHEAVWRRRRRTREAKSG
jgi:metal-responsive CopG/Arc/MetJ family transcriptional regulator